MCVVDMLEWGTLLDNIVRGDVAERGGGGEATKKKVLPQDEKRKEIKKRKPYLTFLEKRENTIDR